MHTIYFPSSRNLFIWLNMLMMLVGLFFLGWRPVIIVFAYVFETIIIGIIHLFKLWMVYRYGQAQRNTPVSKDPRQMNGWGIIPFFLVHYFFFIFVQSVFIFSTVGKGLPGLPSDGFNVLANYRFLLSQTDMQLAFASIAIANLAYSIRNFFIPQRYHVYTLKGLFMQPYIRIFVQQLVAILAGFFFFFADGAMVAAVLLIFTRFALDLYLFAVKYNPLVQQKLIDRITQDGKLKNIRITPQQIDLLLE
jgi:hypothetical protein